jgi:hypothetical protein
VTYDKCWMIQLFGHSTHKHASSSKGTLGQRARLVELVWMAGGWDSIISAQVANHYGSGYKVSCQLPCLMMQLGVDFPTSIHIQHLAHAVL